MVKNNILSEMTGKYLPDSGLETIGVYSTFWTKKYRMHDSESGTFRILIHRYGFRVLYQKKLIKNAN